MAGTRVKSRLLTDKYVKGLKPQAGIRTEDFDSKVSGLAIRVNSGGSKSWVLHYRIGRRKLRWTIGDYADISVKSARRKAQSARTALHEKGIDPSAAKREARTAETFSDLATAYLKDAKTRKRSWGEDDRILRKVFLPVWAHRAAKELTRRDVRAIIAEIVPRAPIAANRALACASAVFNFGVKTDWIEGNPAALIDKQPETSRDRVLTDSETRALWTALDAAATTDPTADVSKPGAIAPMIARGLKVLLLTGQRPGEVFRMRWQDIELPPEGATVDGWWTIPGAFTKNGEPHRVPLVANVCALLREARTDAPDDNPWVFAGENGASVEARAKKAMAALRRHAAIDFDAHRHDLRRTAATGMAESGVSRDTIAKVLNHAAQGGGRVTQVYDRYRYDAEKRAALAAWDRRLTAVLADDQSRVVLSFAR